MASHSTFMGANCQPLPPNYKDDVKQQLSAPLLWTSNAFQEEQMTPVPGTLTKAVACLHNFKTHHIHTHIKMSSLF